MEPLITYFLGLFAFNFVFALAMFAIIVYSRRKEREVTPLKGLAIFSIGWLAGSLLVFVFHLLFALGGTEVQGGPFEAPVSMVVVLSVMYAAFEWLSEARAAGALK
jgi:hypothetical protein